MKKHLLPLLLTVVCFILAIGITFFLINTFAVSEVVSALVGLGVAIGVGYVLVKSLQNRM